MNIYQKILAVTKDLGVVAKNLEVGLGGSRSYKAVSERDILDAVKPLEIAHGICSYPCQREIVREDTLVKVSEYKGNQSTTNTLFMRLKTVYRFVNADDPLDFIETTTYADGLDTADKATGKAMTYCDKYALMKVYKISTGDDPDKDASDPNGYQPRLATSKQAELLKTLYVGDNRQKVLDYYQVGELSELTMETASLLIERAKRR